MRWDSISKISESSTVKSLSIWFVVMPIVAAVLSAPAIQPLVDGIELPFTWGVLYLAALCFFLGSLIYAWRCPAIIREFRSWQDFSEREGSYERLIPLIAEALSDVSANQRVATLSRLHRGKVIEFRDENRGLYSTDAISEMIADADKMALALRSGSVISGPLVDAYSSVREATQRARPVARWSVSALQTIGSMFILIVLAQSCWAVMRVYVS